METVNAAPTIVSRAEWLEARRDLLAKEKEQTRRNDELTRMRRELPWVKVEKDYVFDSPQGKKPLRDLFEGRSQLIVYHFMLGPDWKEGCKSCSFVSDHIDAARLHLVHHDVMVTMVSRAPLPRIEAFKKRMGWGFPWVSSYGNDFNHDYHVSFSADELAQGPVEYNYGRQKLSSEEMHGLSVFAKSAAGDVYHTYSAYARGLDILLGAHNLLDMTPKGRNEVRGAMDWVRHHDKYGD